MNYKPLYLSDHKRPDCRRFTLTFGAPNDTLPQVTIVDGAPVPDDPPKRVPRARVNPTADSLEYWISDPEVLAADSLRLAVRYLKTDTALEQNVWTTDTLRFFFRDTGGKEEDKKKRRRHAENSPSIA